MTFREKLELEYPDNVDSCFVGGCKNCPCDYGYENGTQCRIYDDEQCHDCWNRKMPMTPEEREKLVGNQQTEHGGAGGIIRGGPITVRIDSHDERNNTSCDNTQEERREDNDPVNHPSHYTSGKVECIDAIESAIHAMQGERAFLTGQVIKYLWRWPLKNGVEDLRKARWYLDRLIKFVEEVNAERGN